ncbi:MAG: T9SS type A sorting domain-containing protein, partial [Candidatus Latescibacteria bacterium]|nr:T9SS type A sorting domain-containing protein [Candidatus Latescibacterota bacterium]
TNINGALLTALALMEEDNLTNMIIFLTDGLPTYGPCDKATILENVRNDNQCGTRIFVFGVGFNVNTHLLDGLANENHGISTYLLPGEDIQFAVSSFYSKISDPVLSDPTLDFGSITASDYYPVELPDLFRGSQVIQLGRYSGFGETTVTLSGQSGGTPEESVYEGVQFPAESLEHEFIPRLWATRKIGYLLDQIRLYGYDEEIKDEIVALSKRYGVITPYTSFLILEDEPPEGTFDERLWTENTGEYAVRAADDMKGWGGAENVSDVQSTQVKYVGNKTFFLRDGLWTDSQYTQGEPTLDYEYGSEGYFSLLIGKPDLGRYLAIGKNVIIRVDSQNYRILEETTAVEEEETSQLLDKFDLRQNYPNPFNPNTTISFTVPASAYPALNCRLAVYNLLGQKVRTLIDRRIIAGELKITWDGKDDSGRDVPSGVYFYQLRIGDGKWVKTRKMVLMR